MMKRSFKKHSDGEMVYCTAGALAGAAGAALMMPLVFLLRERAFAAFLALFLYAVLIGFGLRAGRHFYAVRVCARPAAPLQDVPKVLDTSALIDGRIYDICRAGFAEGTMVVPTFVLDELRHIADSGDALRRNRGRRGLDILNKMKTEECFSLRVEERDYKEIQEVDVKLLRLARDLGGVAVTNDYNLNKVAALTGVKVLNVNELANAVRPVVLPNEEFKVTLVREGREPGQGVGYLEDGTMVVVDNGIKHIGETLEVVVTTVLQTNAGRMIFTRTKLGKNAVGF